MAQRPDTHGYSTSRGIPRLRRAISHWYQDRYDVEIDPESEAIVTIGSKRGPGASDAGDAGSNGDTVLVPNPSYPIQDRRRGDCRGAGTLSAAGGRCRSSTNWSEPFVKVIRNRR
ncbi:aminotransferase class I/II-fold pyridoxal phosphate-dependent enzyme [Escherichia coli]